MIILLQIYVTTTTNNNNTTTIITLLLSNEQINIELIKGSNKYKSSSNIIFTFNKQCVAIINTIIINTFLFLSIFNLL